MTQRTNASNPAFSQEAAPNVRINSDLLTQPQISGGFRGFRAERLAEKGDGFL